MRLSSRLCDPFDHGFIFAHTFPLSLITAPRATRPTNNGPSILSPCLYNFNLFEQREQVCVGPHQIRSNIPRHRHKLSLRYGECDRADIDGWGVSHVTFLLPLPHQEPQGRRARSSAAPFRCATFLSMRRTSSFTRVTPRKSMHIAKIIRIINKSTSATSLCG